MKPRYRDFIVGKNSMSVTITIEDSLERKRNSTPAGFEPAPPKENRFLICRRNHLAIAPCNFCLALCPRSNTSLYNAKGWATYVAHLPFSQPRSRALSAEVSATVVLTHMFSRCSDRPCTLEPESTHPETSWQLAGLDALLALPSSLAHSAPSATCAHPSIGVAIGP